MKGGPTSLESLQRTMEAQLSPAPSDTVNHTSALKCKEFANFFQNKVTSVRVGIADTPNNLYDTPENSPPKLRSFSNITESELRKIVTQTSSSTCVLDPGSSKFLKKVYESLASTTLKVNNTSLDTGVFTTAFKTAVVKPQLKESNLDSTVLSNYSPISNLPFLSKVLEKVVFNQLNIFLNGNAILEKFQSGFKSNHSIETTLVKTVNHLRLATDLNQVFILILLDLSAAFDTIDHNIVIQRLEKWVDLSDTVLNCFFFLHTSLEETFMSVWRIMCLLNITYLLV